MYQHFQAKISEAFDQIEISNLTLKLHNYDSIFTINKSYGIEWISCMCAMQKFKLSNGEDAIGWNNADKDEF